MLVKSRRVVTESRVSMLCTGSYMRRYVLRWLLGIGLALSAGCIPVQYDYWKESIESSPDAKCEVSQDTLVCNVKGQVNIGVLNPSTAPVTEAAGLAVEIPVGHVARLTGATATIIPSDGSGSWQSRIVSTEGFRYKDSTSLERISDEPGTDATRELVGSTWNAHRSSNNLHSIYRFEIHSDRTYPEKFDLQLPDIVVDGTPFIMPRASFRYGKRTTIKGLFGT